MAFAFTFLFFFSSRRWHTRSYGDWSSDVCSSDLGTPMPRLALRDPFAVRVLVAVLVVATFFAAGGERMKRLAAAFDWQGVMAPANFRVDAWVSPPPYTGRPPVI